LFALLDSDYRKALLWSLLKRFGEARLANLIHVGTLTLRSWALGGASDHSVGTRGRYIRVDTLLELSKMARDRRFSPQAIEKHVIAIKGYGCSLPACGTRLPIREGPSMIRVLMHFVGDGAIYPLVGSTKVSGYSNQNTHLRKQFVSYLSALFGDVSLCAREDLSSQERAHVKVSKWIAYLLVHFYPDARFGQSRSRLPVILFSLPRELKIEAIRTLADDDGSVQELCVRFVSGSRILLEDTRRLILQLIHEDDELSELQKRTLERSLSPVRKQRSWYRLDLGFHMFEWYRRNIGFSHPEKAQEIEFRLKAASRTRELDALTRDYLVFCELARGRKTALEIARAHYIREEYVHESLHYHSSLGRARRFGKLLSRKKAAAQWVLTEEGRIWIQTLDLVNGARTKSLMRKVLPKRDYMRYRWLKPLTQLEARTASEPSSQESLAELPLLESSNHC